MNSVPASSKSFDLFLNQTDSSVNSMTLTPVTEEEVLVIVDGLSCSNACGADSIPAKLIKGIKHNIVGPLTTLINRSFMEGKFPETCKLSIIKPLFKKGERDIFDNYRPTSCNF